MFISNKNSIVTPQSEHARLSATIAMLWGNSDFEKTTLPQDSFVRGVLFHDRGFGSHDNYSLGNLSKEERELTLIDGILKASNDPVADIVTLLHIKRLTKMYPPEQIKEIADLCDKTLELKMKTSKFSKEEFTFADRITELADDIAFDFAFGDEDGGEASVLKKHDDKEFTQIKFTIQGITISMNPWPLSVDHYEGFIIGYEKEGYPQVLNSQLINFILKK
ncbi:MAG: DUF3891 family protein [Candidatus Taylorbacteria bacterium]|nr:DUF3891 family protein [Candidatus Taylorbacteria bacterium]